MTSTSKLQKIIFGAGLVLTSVSVVGAGVLGLNHVASEVHYASMIRKIRYANIIIHTPTRRDILDKYWRCEHGMDEQLRQEYLKRVEEIPYNLIKEPNYVGARDSTAPFTPPSTIRAGIPLYLPDVDGDGHVGCTQYPSSVQT